MVLSTETFNQSVRTEYSEAVNARYTFQPLWVSDIYEFAYTNEVKLVNKDSPHEENCEFMLGPKT